MAEEKELERVIKEIKEADTLEKKAIAVQGLIKEVKDEKLKKELIKVLKIIQDIILGREVSLERMLDVPFKIPLLPPPKIIPRREIGFEAEKKEVKVEREKPSTYTPISYTPKTTYMGKPVEKEKEKFQLTYTEKKQETKPETPFFGGFEKPSGLIQEKPQKQDYMEKPKMEDYKKVEEFKPIREEVWEKKKEKKW